MHTAVIQHLTICWLDWNSLQCPSRFYLLMSLSPTSRAQWPNFLVKVFPRNSRSQAFLLLHHDSKLLNKSLKPLMKQINQMMMMKNKKQSSKSERIHRAREIKKKIFFCCYFGKNPKWLAPGLVWIDFGCLFLGSSNTISIERRFDESKKAFIWPKKSYV